MTSPGNGGVNIEMEYRAPWISCGPPGETVDYDAVWFSQQPVDRRITQYRGKARPVHFHLPGGIRNPPGLAGELGFVGTEVSVSDLLSAIQAGSWSSA